MTASTTLAALTIAAATTLTPVNYDPASEVDCLLVLAVDISQSMDDGEQKVQRRGYAEAITSKEVMDAIKMGPTGRIAVTYVEWGGIGEQFVVSDWQVIDGPASAAAFASDLASKEPRHAQRTAVGDALLFSAAHIASAPYTGLRQVIDISGDGMSNHGTVVSESRDEVVSRGITINGLPILAGTGNYTPPLEDYYRKNVIGGAGSFIVPIHDLADFANAVRRKLVMEIAALEEGGE